MREVAPALTGTHKASGSPPSTRPAKPSSSLLPNVTSDCNGLCERRANAGVHPRLWQRWLFPLALTHKRVGRRGMNAPSGKFCRRLYRALTIPAQAQGIREPISVGGTIAMRIYGPNGTALAATPTAARRTGGGSFSVSEEECPRNAASTAISAGDFDCRCADRPSGGGRPDRAQEAGGRQGPKRTRRARTLKLGLLDGSVDQSTLAA